MTLSIVLSTLWQAAAQTAPANASAPPPSHALSSSAIVEMLRNSGPVALTVLGLLLITSVYSWAIMLGKWSSMRRARVQSGRFVRAFRKAARLEEVAAVSGQFQPSPLVPLFNETFEEYERQTQGGAAPLRSIPALERTAQTAASEALTTLESRMTWLATIGAVAPFLGLFGTIWGIIDAFHGLGTAGAATLRAVAPGVSEALITTAAGLAVAVPAVVGYNQFNAQLREFGARLDDFGRELLNVMESTALQAFYPQQMFQPQVQEGPRPSIRQPEPSPQPGGRTYAGHSNLPRY